MHISGYVSVIVPMHQGALTIMRCLEAIAAQTYRPLEIVVVDDGSTDPGPAWVRAFRRAHLDVPVTVVSQPRAGTGPALAAGLAAARGEFVAFAHQADQWAPVKLALQVAQLQGRPDAGFALADVTEVVGAAQARVRAGALWRPRRLALSALVARRSAVEAVGGGADVTELVRRLAAAAPGMRLPVSVAACHRPAPAPRPAGTLARLVGVLAGRSPAATPTLGSAPR